MKKITLVLSLILSFNAWSFIERLPMTETLPIVEKSFSDINENFAVFVSTIYKPGELVILLAKNPENVFNTSIIIPRGPGSFDNLSDMNDIGRHNVQWKISVTLGNMISLKVTGKKKTIYNLYRWIEEQKTLRPYFQNKIKFGYLVDFAYNPNSDPSLLSVAKDYAEEFKCTNSIRKRTFCPGMAEFPYTKVDSCWRGIDSDAFEELTKSMESLKQVDGNALTESLCLSRNPTVDLKTRLAQQLIENLNNGEDGTGIIHVPTHLWKTYEIQFINID